jgi:tetratricopeptide (TPR) repeat protein
LIGEDQLPWDRETMALSRSTINIIFACAVIALALVAGGFVYLHSDRPGAAPSETPNPTDNTLPETHPPVDAAERLAALEQMSAKDPQNPDHQTQVANLYYDLGQYEKAADFYERSLKLRPKDPNVETDLAVCYHYLGRSDKALETLDKVLGYSPGFAQAMFNKGVILANAKKDAKGAIIIWEELLRSNPDYPQRPELEKRIRQLKGSM